MQRGGKFRKGIVPWGKFHISNWWGISPAFLQCRCGTFPLLTTNPQQHQANTYGEVQFLDNSDAEELLLAALLCTQDLGGAEFSP